MTVMSGISDDGEGEAQIPGMNSDSCVIVVIGALSIDRNFLIFLMYCTFGMLLLSNCQTHLFVTMWSGLTSQTDTHFN